VPHRDAVLQTASLDHALWFLRPFRADEWLLYDETSPSAGYGRALTQGRIFDREGRMVAAVVQEGLTRYERNPDEASIAKGNMA
jgi:acyl-CoA thioesterase-2